MQRLVDHPVSKHVESFIMKYRRKLPNINEDIKIPQVCIFFVVSAIFFYSLKINIHFIFLQLEYDNDNRPFVLIDSKYKINYQYYSHNIVIVWFKNIKILFSKLEKLFTRRLFINIKTQNHDSFIECARKDARGEVKVIGNGSGKITINGKDLTYFDDMQCREQVSTKNSLNNFILRNVIIVCCENNLSNYL